MVSLVGNLTEFDVLHPIVLETKSTGITVYQTAVGLTLSSYTFCQHPVIFRLYIVGGHDCLLT
jgi:hypothetical protein